MPSPIICCEACGAACFGNVHCLTCLRWQERTAGTSALLRTLIANTEKRLEREGGC